jgi:hypothetical protein
VGKYRILGDAEGWGRIGFQPMHYRISADELSVFGRCTIGLWAMVDNLENRSSYSSPAVFHKALTIFNHL